MTQKSIVNQTPFSQKQGTGFDGIKVRLGGGTAVLQSLAPDGEWDDEVTISTTGTTLVDRRADLTYRMALAGGALAWLV